MKPADDNAYEVDIQSLSEREQTAARQLIRRLRHFAIDPTPDVPSELQAKIMACAAKLPPPGQGGIGRLSGLVTTARRVPRLMPIQTIVATGVAIAMVSTVAYLSVQIGQQRQEIVRLQTAHAHTLHQLTSVQEAQRQLQTRLLAQSNELRQAQFDMIETRQYVQQLQTDLTRSTDQRTAAHLSAEKEVNDAKPPRSGEEETAEMFGVLGDRWFPKTMLGTF